MDENPRVAELRKKLEKDPGSRLFAQLAEELRKDGKHDEAVVVARKGLEKHPNYPSARLTLARALLDSAQPAEAKPELEQIVKASPDNILASRLLGDALEDLGQLEAAQAQFEKTLRLSPGDKALLEKITDLKARLAPPPTIEIRPVRPAADAVAEPPITELPTPEPPPAAAVASIALDRDLASGTFSPGSLNVADLQKHFDETAVPSESASPAQESSIERTVGFGEFEHFGVPAAAEVSRAVAGPPPELETEIDRTVAFTPADPPALPDPADEPIALSPSSSFEAEPEPMFESTPVVSRATESEAELTPSLGAETPEFEEEDAGGQTIPVTSMTLADLYLQQGLKKEASAVLSQVLKDEPDNAAAQSRLAEVEPEIEPEIEPLPDVVAEPEPFSETAPLSPPWLNGGAPPGPSEPVPSPPPSLGAPIALSAAAPVAPLTNLEIRERTLAELQAFLSAVERESIEQRATERGVF
jgi:tetratricopeptide (TPR) repeat protein